MVYIINMLTSDSASQIFNNLKGDPENTKCFECGSEGPTFVSVNNGCFICATCVQSHLSLGFQISRIKSMEEDWAIDDLRLVTAGGNSSLKEFFTHYNLVNTPPNFKYMTRASHFYRDMLAVVAQDHEYPHPCPSVEEGAQLVPSAYPELPAYPGNSEEAKVAAVLVPGQPVTTEKKSAWGWAKAAYSKTVDAGNKTADKIGEKINKFSEKPQVKKMENKTLEIAGKIENGLSSLINSVKSKPAVQSTVVTVKHGYEKINSDPAVQKLKADTMMFLQDLSRSVRGVPKPAEEQKVES